MKPSELAARKSQSNAVVAKIQERITQILTDLPKETVVAYSYIKDDEIIRPMIAQRRDPRLVNMNLVMNAIRKLPFEQQILVVNEETKVPTSIEKRLVEEFDCTEEEGLELADELSENRMSWTLLKGTHKAGRTGGGMSAARAALSSL